MLKTNRNHYRTDLWIIGLSIPVFYAVYGIFYMIFKIDMGKFPLLLQTLMAASVEFGIMGLGITIVCIRNRQSFASFGLKKERLLLTIALSALVCLPAFLYILLSNETVPYFPLQSVNYTKPLLAAGFPVNMIGMLIVSIIWGFFEGFSYVVMSDRINKVFPPKNLILNWGAVICAIFCLLIHILFGQSYGIVDAAAEFILIYGMLAVYRYTGNAWGCVLIFYFFWSAFGT